ncbi:MAG: HAD-IA family hydrolase [bacterium]|nr:HAD-IA family hydrolase [bacterium]
MRKKIKIIIFDLGGVVVHGGYLEFIGQYCLNCLTSAGHKKILKLEHDVNLGKISEADFYRQLQSVFGVHLTAKRMHDLILEKMQPNKLLLKILAKLKKSKIVMFTNSIGHIAQEALGKGRKPLKSFFGHVFDSTKIHLAKPDAKAFQYILKKMKVKPQESLFVDDRLENIIAARKIGMNGIVYKSASQFKKTLKSWTLAN